MRGLLTILAYVLAFVTLTLGERIRYDGHQIWRVIPTSRIQLDFLGILKEESQKFQLDFWKEPSALHRPVVFKIPPSKRNEIYIRLGLQGLVPEVTLKDLQKNIEKEDALYTQKSFNGLENFDYSKYHPLSDVNAWMEQMANSYSNRVELFNISSSYEGRTITAMKITGANSSDSRPGFFFNGGIHAREWISPATVIYMAAQLIEQYGKNQEITDLLDEIDWYILPVFNVDGYEYTWTKDRNWRKTRSKHFLCHGVDPNRNWDWEWCKNGASKDPCSDTYCGPRPFSESEVKGVADFLNSVPGRFRAYIDFHSFSQLWMTPWGYTTALPPEFPVQDKCSTTATDALTAVHGTEYKHGNIASTIYTASGSSADWAFGAAKILYSTAVELRDTGEYGFLLPADQIIPSGEETLQGLLAMAKFILNNP
ncbi:carboxypeptidase B-like [Liolophura sinensis]|uniref:carboxypeptidase B-like n=1 Tax=Liolophura sinensis TaxID=3198878 RepID=UPI0031591708